MVCGCNQPGGYSDSGDGAGEHSSRRGAGVEESPLPIEKLFRLQAKLNIYILSKRWDKVRKVAMTMIKGVQVASDPDRCRTGKPHIDGIYQVGSMYYERAPKDVKESVNLLNKSIRDARERSNALSNKKKRSRK